jgi:SWI/SNF-related matrix-associated actin-dependent regulator 1 of chromatin subfamily A
MPRPIAPVAPYGGPPTALTQFSRSPSQPALSKKRKLVRGGSHKLDSDGDSLPEEEEEEELEYRDEVFDEKVLNFLNASSAEEISDISFTPVEQIEVFISNRPFGSLEIARVVEIPPTEDSDSEPNKRSRGRRAAKKGRNIGNRIVDGVEEVLKGYNGVDDLITECEAIGKRVREKLAKWTSASKEMQDEGALTLTSINASTPSTATTDPSPAPSEKDVSEFMPTIQPGILADDVQLKDYQIIGVNWLHLLYNQGLSCILADEMGLGKTCQVIAFLGGLLERTGGQRGKHLVVVPSSTIGMHPVILSNL